MKTVPMTAGQFADYAASIPESEKGKFNAMLAFIEEVVTEKCAQMIEANVHHGEQLNPTQIAFNGIWYYEAKRIRDSRGR